MVPTTSVRQGQGGAREARQGQGERQGQWGSKGQRDRSKGSETGSEGSKTGSKGSKVYAVVTKNLISTYSPQVSPPPPNRTSTQCTFIEPQKAFVGPYHGPKILGQKQPINH